ncbi:MAG: hypothetical protein WBO77_01105 [Microgenomates group bacterium]
MDFSPPLREGYPGMLVRVIGLLDETVIAKVELFFDADWHLLERLYLIEPGAEGWNLLELGFKPGEDGTSEVEEVRLMREIDPLSAPSWDELTPTTLEHNGMLFRFVGEGGGKGVIIGADNQYRLIGTSLWKTFEARANDTTHLLVYATWDGGSGVYAGQLVSQDDAHIRLAEAPIS